MTSLHSAHRLLRTITQHQARQVAAKIFGSARRRLAALALPNKPAALRCRRLSTQAPFLEHVPWGHDQDPESGTFAFLNSSIDLGSPPRWRDAPLALLWQFHLHGFEYLPAAPATMQLALCRSWAASFPTPEQPAWHPYPTSIRISDWIKAGMQTDIDLAQSLYKQAAYLRRTMEAGLGGNHLLENCRALIFAGLAFGEEESHDWLRRGLDTLVREIDRQVLPDGGHFERTPAYHSRVLELVLDVHNVLPDAVPEKRLLASTAMKMADFLAAVTHPDGSLALLSDSSPEVAPAPGPLLEYAKIVARWSCSRRHTFPETGYFVVSDPPIYLLLDGGELGPKHLPAHGHADLFTFELSLGGERFVVDTGVGTYQRGDLRDYVRSTAAHNALVVDGVSQAECWHRFRVARRFPPRDVDFHESREQWTFRGFFDGYRSLIGDELCHERQVKVDGQRRAVEVSDRVSGKGCHRAESFIHLHPDVDVEVRGRDLTLTRSNVTARLAVLDGSLEERTTPYCPDFNIQVPRTSLVLTATGKPPLDMRYRISTVAV